MTIHLTEAEKTAFENFVNVGRKAHARNERTMRSLDEIVKHATATAGPAPSKIAGKIDALRRDHALNEDGLAVLDKIAAHLTTEPETDQPSPAAEERGAMTLDRIRGIADRCTTTGLEVQLRPLAEGATLLRLTGQRWDADVDDRAPQHGRWLYVSTHATESEVVQTLWLAVQLFELHELREEFQFDGVPIFHPHHNLAKLRGFVSGTQRDAREPMPKDHAAAAAELDTPATPEDPRAIVFMDPPYRDTPATPPNDAAPAGDAEPSDDELGKAIGAVIDRLFKAVTNADGATIERRRFRDGSYVFECPCGEGWVGRKPNGRRLDQHHPTAEEAEAELGTLGFGPAAGELRTEAGAS